MKVRLLVIAILYLAMLTGGFGLLSVDSSLMLDLRLSVGRDEFYDLIAAQVAEGRTPYLYFHVLDYLFIVLFYPFLHTLVLKADGWACSSVIGGWAAILTGIFDLTENIGVDWALLSYPRSPIWLAVVVQVSTPLKFLGIVLAMLTILAAVPKHLSDKLGR